jgi:hypothetical protein
LVGTQGFTLTKLVLYCLSHTSSPFFSDYFRDVGLKNYLHRLALDHDPPDLNLPSGQHFKQKNNSILELQDQYYMLILVQNLATACHVYIG